jgi:Mrp family chromosome partitioning ATPase
VRMTTRWAGIPRTSLRWNGGFAPAGPIPPLASSGSSRSIYCRPALRPADRAGSPPSILAEAIALPGDRGLAQVLAGEASFDELVQPVDVVPAETGSDARGRVDVLVAGPVIGSSLDLVDSDRMRDLLASVHEHYDLVVIDSPAVSEAEDFLPLATMVRAVIVVSRPGHA